MLIIVQFVKLGSWYKCKNLKIDKRQGNFTFTPFNLNHPSCYITLKTNIFYVWVRLTPGIKSFQRCLLYNLSKQGKLNYIFKVAGTWYAKYLTLSKIISRTDSHGRKSLLNFSCFSPASEKWSKGSQSSFLKLLSSDKGDRGQEAS